MRQINSGSRLQIFTSAFCAFLAFLFFASGAAAQTQFSELTKLTYPPGTASANFGIAVSIDGNTMIVGANG